MWKFHLFIYLFSFWILKPCSPEVGELHFLLALFGNLLIWGGGPLGFGGRCTHVHGVHGMALHSSARWVQSLLPPSRSLNDLWGGHFSRFSGLISQTDPGFIWHWYSIGLLGLAQKKKKKRKPCFGYRWYRLAIRLHFLIFLSLAMCSVFLICPSWIIFPLLWEMW